LSDPPVLARQEGRVRVLTLNRPAARNALDTATRAALIQSLRDADADASVGAVVLTGAGNAFAAGADLRELLARTSAEQEAFLQPPHIYSVVEALSKPVVAALNGHALGAGLELATACDLRICAPAAKLGQPEINLALIPGGGGTQRLARLVGPAQAAKLVLTGEPVDATEALRIGLVDEVAEDALARAVAIAAAIAGKDPAAVAAAKQALRAARDLPYREGLAKEVHLFVGLHARPEARDRIQRFLEKAK
jgi:enoyl-CoA hydratase/carnithine racemase